MNLTFLTGKQSQRLLLIYAGWSTDPSAFGSLNCPGYDIAVCWDYSSLEPPVISGYSEVVLLAWSLGVRAAELTAGSLPLTLTIAVNGTPTPANDLTGIPEAIYFATIAGLNEQSLTKFRRRMGATDLPRGSRTIESLQSELSEFPLTPIVDFRWDRALISTEDRIFPPDNQRRFWINRAEITEINSSHTPDFQEIITRFVIDKSLVSQRFKRGMETYDETSDVQQRIADQLFSLWRKHGLTADSLLEIGVGSGYLTSLYRPRLSSSSVTLWDITPAFQGVDEADAEVALPQIDTCFDAIVSASTIQWFNSIGAFFRQCSRHLISGGLAVLSTFGPETFRELETAGVIGLPYLAIESIRRLVPADCEILELHEGKILKTFQSPTDVLRHLKSTGVNARPSRTSVREIIASYPVRPDGTFGLTYQPIYLIFRKK